MNRKERRIMAALMREQAADWPEKLEEVPQTEWPRVSVTGPLRVWRSREFLVQEYEAPAFEGRRCVRLTVNRVTIQPDGHWNQEITWDELQRVKREAGYGGDYAVEVYPRDQDIVFDANMRHLWVLNGPLPIGWRKKG